MVADSIPQLKSLSLAKKRVLISELLGEVFGEPVQEPEVLKALEKRIAHFRREPDSAKSWAEVKLKLRRRK